MRSDSVAPVDELCEGRRDRRAGASPVGADRPVHAGELCADPAARDDGGDGAFVPVDGFRKRTTRRRSSLGGRPKRSIPRARAAAPRSPTGPSRSCPRKVCHSASDLRDRLGQLLGEWRQARAGSRAGAGAVPARGRGRAPPRTARRHHARHRGTSRRRSAASSRSSRALIRSVTR